MNRVLPIAKGLYFLSLTLALAAAAALFSAPVQAQQENCDQCKYLRCLKSTVERKKKLVGVYQELHNFWKGRSTDARGTPLMVLDLSSHAEPERSRLYRAAIEQLGQYATMEESKTNGVPAAEGCGYGEGEKSAATDSFESCKTTGLDAAKAAQPCKQLADLIAAHEASHAAACKTRQQPASAYWPYKVTNANGNTTEKYFPPKIITPAGLAAEEMSAYQMEIASLQKIVDALEKKCRKVSFNNVTLDCVMGSGPYRVRMGQKLAGEACGDPVKATWTIKQTHFMEAPGVPTPPPSNDEFDSDCVEAGGDIEKHYTSVYRKARAGRGGGWFCVYRDKPKPQVTIRWFRPEHCEGPAEQAVTVDAVIGEKCEEKSEPTPPLSSIPIS